MSAITTRLEALLSRVEDLAGTVEQLRQQLAAFRFESHQEHQELYRYPKEGPCAWAPTPRLEQLP